MERLTERLENGVINVKYASQHETAIHRLVAIEDILGDEYDLDELREMVQANIPRLIDEQPTISAVPVVRCQECRYYPTAKVNEKGFLICPASGMEITETDYCSYGERMDKEDEHEAG